MSGDIKIGKIEFDSGASRVKVVPALSSVMSTLGKVASAIEKLIRVDEIAKARIDFLEMRIKGLETVVAELKHDRHRDA